MRRATVIGLVRAMVGALDAMSAAGQLPVKVFVAEVAWWLRHFRHCRRLRLPLLPPEWEDTVYHTI